MTMVSRFYFHLDDLSIGEDATPIPTKQSEDLVFVCTFPTASADEPPTPPPKDKKWLFPDVLHIRPVRSSPPLRPLLGVNELILTFALVERSILGCPA